MKQPSSVTRQMTLAAASQAGDYIHTAGRIRPDLVAAIEQNDEHRRLVIASPDRPPSEDEIRAFQDAFGLDAQIDEPVRRIIRRRTARRELRLILLLDSVARRRPDVWQVVEFRWIQLAEPAEDLRSAA